jgi:hypothetical protein
MKELIINDIEIKKDDSGRFSLNDLHKSAGGNKKYEPYKFMRSESFKNVVDILKHQNRGFNPVSKRQGRYGGGTWICKELVYKYAMWVSAEFEVKVIQTFDKAINNNGIESSMIALNELAKKIDSDKRVASFLGAELQKYRKIKEQNIKEWNEQADKAQISLGI